jgi:hypothetical protein
MTKIQEYLLIPSPRRMDLDELRPIIPELRSIVYQYVDLHKEADELDELREQERQKIQREKDVKQCLCDNLCHLFWIIITIGPCCLLFLAVYFELYVMFIVLFIFSGLVSALLLTFYLFFCCPHTCWCCCLRCGDDARNLLLWHRYYGSEF